MLRRLGFGTISHAKRWLFIVQAIWLGLPVYAAIQVTPNGFLFTGTTHHVLINATNGSIRFFNPSSGQTLAESGEAGLWFASAATNTSHGKTGDINAISFHSSSSSNRFSWSLPSPSNTLSLTYSNHAITVVVFVSERTNGIEMAATVHPRLTNLLSIALPAPLTFNPVQLSRFIAPSHTSDGVGMAYNSTYFVAQDEDDPASWKQDTVGPSPYVDLYGGNLTFGAYAATNISFTIDGTSWLGAAVTNKWSLATAIVHRPPAAGQSDIILVDSPAGAYFSGSKLGGGAGAGYLMRIGGAVDRSRTELSLDLVAGALEYLSATAGGRTNVALLSMVRGPVIGFNWPSSVRIDEWRNRILHSSVLASRGIRFVELANIPDMYSAMTASNYLAIVNPYGELVPASLSGGVPATVTNIGNYVRAGGHWFETGGHPFYQSLQPELYYTNNLYYPPVFADFFQLETTAGNLALYGVQPDSPTSPAWSGATNIPAIFVPGQLIWGGDSHGGWMQRSFHMFVSAGQLWQSPNVRMVFGQSATDALAGYALANNFERTLEDKMPLEMQSTFKQSVLIHLRGSAASITGRLPLIPAPALIHFEEYLKGGFDKEYPDHLPPNPEFGTVAAFTNFIEQARQAGHLTMPYTNPTFWGVDPKGPTFLATNDAPLLVNLDGSLNYEEYFGHGGMTVTPWHPAVQAANRHTRNQFTTNYPVDMLFHDQLGARTWQYDLNPVSPTPYAYLDGLIQIAAEDGAAKPIATENGYDRLINYESQFCGLAWGLAPTPNAPVWRRFLRERYAPSTWSIFPLAQFIAHDKVAFTFNNLEGAIHNHEVMAWTLGLGYNMTYVTEADALATNNASQAWLAWLSRMQKSVASRYTGRGVTSFMHTWGTNSINPANGTIAATYGPVSIIANLSADPCTTNGWHLPGYGYVASANGLVAGHLIPSGQTNATAFIAETNGPSSVRFWIHGAGGSIAHIVLPAGYTGNTTVQLETNNAIPAETSGNVLPIMLPASTNMALWSGTASFHLSTPVLIDFGRHDTNNGMATVSPDIQGHYWNNLSPPANGSSVVATGTKLASMVNITNGTTSLGIETLTGGWNANGLLNGGLFQPYGPQSNLLGKFAIESATMDYFFTSTNDAFKITGMNTGSLYNFVFFGSRSDAVERVTSYAIGSLSTNLRVSGSISASSPAGTNRNDGSVATLSAIAPGPAGDITVRVSKVSGSFAHINLMQIEEIPTSPTHTPAPGIHLSPSSLSFVVTNRGPNPPAQSFAISNTGMATLHFTMTTNATWLGLAPASGSIAAGAGQMISVSVNNNGLSPGISNAIVTVADPLATNNPQTLIVSLTVTNPPATGMVTQSVYLVDFGRHDGGNNGLPTSSPDPNGNYWNNLGGSSQSVAAGLAISNLITTTNSASDIVITITSAGWSCNGILNGGLIAPSPALLGILAVTNATMDYFFTTGSDTFTLAGLNPSHTYNLEFFASRATNQTRVTTYSSGTNAVMLASSGAGIGAGGVNYNNNTTAVLRAISPDGSGRISVTVSATTGGFGYVGILKIEEIGSPASTNPAPVISIAPLNLGFSSRHGSESNPPPQSFSITNRGTAPLDFTISTNATWLTCSPVSGVLATGAGQQITVHVNHDGLRPGVSNAVITIADPDAINSPRTVHVGLTIQSTNPVLAIFGSSVAKGFASSGFTSGVLTNGSWTNGYTYFITRHLAENYGYYVTNASTPGDNTATAIARFPTYIAPITPAYVLLGYSLGNEGFSGTTGATSSNIVQNFKANLMTLVSMCRSNGFYPVIGSVYPRGDYTSGNYALLKQTHLEINTWNVPSLNLLTPIDDGAGRWVSGYWQDGNHPNDAGYYEFYLSLVPTLFAAIDAGKTNSPALGSATNFARMTYDPTNNAPLVFMPGYPMRSFTTSFRLLTRRTGTVATVQSSGTYATLEVRSNTLVYISRDGAETVMPTNLTGGAWHDVALSHRYAMSNTVVYLNGTLMATIPEQLAPDQFVLGGPGASGRASAPEILFLDTWCVYRAGWTLEEASAQRNGLLQQSSMEIGAMFDEASFTGGSAIANQAQSLSQAIVSGSNMIAVTVEDTLLVPSDWEQQYFGGDTNYLITESSDYDADGLKDWQEYVAGTVPTNPASKFEVASPANTSGTNAVYKLRWTSISNRNYSVYRSLSLVHGFTSLTNGMPSTPPENIFIDLDETNHATRYYRIGVALEP